MNGLKKYIIELIGTLALVLMECASAIIACDHIFLGFLLLFD